MKIFLAVSMLLFASVASADTAKLLEAKGIKYSKLKTLRASDGSLTTITGTIRTSSCVDLKGESKCRLESIDKLLPVLWEAYEVPEKYQTKTEVLLSVLSTDNGLYTTKLAQVVNGIPVHKGGLTIVTNEKGDVLLVAGSLVSYTAEREPKFNEGLFELIKLLDKKLKSEKSLIPQQSLEGSVKRGVRMTKLADGGSVEQRVESSTGLPFWLYSGPSLNIEVHGDKIVSDSSSAIQSNKGAYIPHRVHADPTLYQDFTIQYDYTQVGYDYNYITGQCQYQARYDSSTKDVNRVDDLYYSDAYDNASCYVPPTVHSSTSFGHTDVREWDYLWWMKKYTAYADASIYPAIYGGIKTPINSRINGGTSSCGGAGGCYTASNSTITVGGDQPTSTQQKRHSLQLYAHEYGHHLNATYGGSLSGGCGTTSHRSLIHQWIAESVGFALAVEADAKWHQTYYGDVNSFAGSLAHWTVDNFLPDFACHSDTWLDMANASWEVMWDVDCLAPGSLCHGGSSPVDVSGHNDLGYSTSYLRRHLLRGVMYVGLLEPPSSSSWTIQSAGAMFRTYSVAALDTQGENAVDSIFAHHGF